MSELTAGPCPMCSTVHPNPARTVHDFCQVAHERTYGLIDCPTCRGDGTIDFNPSRSFPPDPQMVQSARCGRCHGDGTLDAEEEIERLSSVLREIADTGRKHITDAATRWPLAFVTYAVDTAEGALDA